MGRYYSGDIEGKFWFAVQDSDDANFFGVIGTEPPCLEYFFEKEDLKKVKKGITTCKKELGSYKKKLDNFFKKNHGYNNEMIVKEFEIQETKVKDLLVWYARLKLGEKIAKSVVKNGQCGFTAEL